MTQEIAIAEFYGNLLLDSAIRGNISVKDICEELSAFCGLLSKSEELCVLIMSKSMPFTMKIEAWNKVKDQIQKQLTLSTLVQNLLFVLIKNGRSHLIMQLNEVFPELWLKHQGITRVLVITANELSKNSKTTLKSELERMIPFKSIVDFKKDSEILGGVVITWKSDIVDFSIKGELNRLRYYLMG